MVVLSLTTVFAENQKKGKEGKLKGKKIVMIIAKQMFEESEFKYPKRTEVVLEEKLKAQENLDVGY